MKGMLVVIAFALAVACGGTNGGNTVGASNPKPGANPDNWLGSAWNGNVTTTVSCPGQAQQNASTLYKVAFSTSSDADFQYSSSAGCTYKFKVSGNTAALSNAPVSCSTTSSGFTITATWTQYTLTTSDGHNLTLTASGSASEQSTQTTCPFSQTGTATR
jgi:hypothetical protein